MQKQLSIIIPRYSEDETLLKPTLTSVQQQVGYKLSDLEVIIVDDAGPKPLKAPRCYDFPIRIIRLEENVGPGEARQRGTEQSKADWIYYLDADDRLYPDAALGLATCVRENPRLNWLSFGGRCLGEKDQVANLVPHKSGLVWVFGHFFRRTHLAETGSKFHPLLRSNEEQYLLHHLNACTQPDQHMVSDYPVYIWEQRDTHTITRYNNAEYAYTCPPEWTYGRRLVIDDLKKLGKDTAELLMQSLIHGYYTAHQTMYDKPAAKKYKESLLSENADLYKENKDQWEKLNKDVVRQCLLSGAPSCDRQVTIPLEDWLESLEKVKKVPLAQPYEHMIKTQTEKEETTNAKRRK